MTKSTIHSEDFLKERFSVLDSGNTLGEVDLQQAVKQVKKQKTASTDTGCNHWGWGDTPEKSCNHWGFDN